MGMWTVPTIITGIIIVAISYFLTAGVMKKLNTVNQLPTYLLVKLSETIQWR